jgi:hypothetical protein
VLGAEELSENALKVLGVGHNADGKETIEGVEFTEESLQTRVKVRGCFMGRANAACLVSGAASPLLRNAARIPVRAPTTHSGGAPRKS